MVVVVMGVTGAGKSTVGALLARRLGWRFHDADDLHPARNRALMAAGHPLSDSDRQPWLEAVRELIERSLRRGADAVVACSALKRSYRDRVFVDPARMRLVYLRGEAKLLRQRLEGRCGHFMNPALLPSQLATLEPPESAIAVDIEKTPDEIVGQIIAALRNDGVRLPPATR